MVVKELDGLRLAVLAENVTAFGDDVLGPVFARLYPQLHKDLAVAGICPVGPDIAHYDHSGEEEAPIRVMAGVPVEEVAALPPPLSVLELPGEKRAATTIHKGTMAQVGRAYDVLGAWVEAGGERVEGYGREVYLACGGDQETWVTEVQFPLI